MHMSYNIDIIQPKLMLSSLFQVQQCILGAKVGTNWATLEKKMFSRWTNVNIVWVGQELFFLQNFNYHFPTKKKKFATG